MARLVITPALMTLLFQGFNKLYQKGLEAGDPLYTSLVTTVPSTTSTNVYGWLGKSTGFKKWVGDRVLQSLATHSFSVKNEPFENTVEVSRNQIEDDEYGVLSPIFEQLGQDAAEHPDEVIFGLLKTGLTTLCYDGLPYFSASHPTTDTKGKVTTQSNVTLEAGGKPQWYVFDNSRVIKPLIWQVRKPYKFTRIDQESDEIVFLKNQALYGADARVAAGFGLWQLGHMSQQDLTAANFKAVRQKMRGLKGDNGRPLRVRPVEIHVPTTLESAAEVLFKNATGANGATNELYNAAKVVVNPWLD